MAQLVPVTVSAMVAVAVVGLALELVPVTVTVTGLAVAAAVPAAVRVSTLLAVAGLVPKVPVTPVGKPDTARFTLPENGLTSVIAIVSAALEPAATESVEAEGVSLKLPVGAPVMVNAMVALGLWVPLFPVTVTVMGVVVGVAVLVAVNVSTVEVSLEVGLNEAETPVGNPVTEKDILPMAPVIAMASVTLAPGATETAVDAGVSVAPGMTTVRGAELVIVPLVPTISIV